MLFDDIREAAKDSVSFDQSVPLWPNAAPDLNPAGPLGHWDPASLRWVNDVPTTVEGTAAGVLFPPEPPSEPDPHDVEPTPPEQGLEGGSEPTTPPSEPDPHDTDPSVPETDPNTVNPPPLNTAGGHKAYLDDLAGPLRSGGHWDPAALRWVPDEPTSSVGRVLDDDHTDTLGEKRLPADQESTSEAAIPYPGTLDPGPDVPPGEAPTLDPDLIDPTSGTAPWEQPVGHWDPAALRWVTDVPTTVEGTAADEDTAGPMDEWSPHLPTTRQGSAATLFDDDSAGHTGNGFGGSETDAGMRGHDPISSSGSSPFGDFQEPRHEVEEHPPENNDFDFDLF